MRYAKTLAFVRGISPSIALSAAIPLLTWFTVLFFLGLGYGMFVETAHALGHSQIRFPAVANAIAVHAPSLLLATALMFPFMVADPLRWFVCGSGLYLVLLQLFWMSLGLGYADYHGLVSLVFASGLFPGILLVGIAGRQRGLLWWVFSYLPAIGTLIGFVVFAQWADRHIWITERGRSLYSWWPTGLYAGLALVLLLAASVRLRCTAHKMRGAMPERSG